MYYNGEMVRLRPPEREDLPLFVEWLSNPDLRKFVTIRYISLGLEEQWYERLLESTGKMPPSRVHFVIEAIDSAQPIGVTSLENINWCDRTSEVGIIVGDQALLGQGLRHRRDARAPAGGIRLVQPASHRPARDRRQRARDPLL